MTTNQTIDGVPRKLLERIEYLIRATGVEHMCVMELRALLDAPASSDGWYLDECENARYSPEENPSTRVQVYPVAWRGCNADGEVVTEWIDGVPPERMTDLCSNPASFDRIECAYAAPAAQPQAEPVAWRVTGRGGLTVTPQYPKWAVGERGLTIAPLYGKQPAPVAVVLPERMGHSTRGNGWNACIDELKRLNPSL